MEKKGGAGGVQDTGRWGGRRSEASAADRQHPDQQTDTPSDTNSSAMLGISRENHRRNPAVAPLKHPGRAGPGPRGAATAVAHLYLRKDQARQGAQTVTPCGGQMLDCGRCSENAVCERAAGELHWESCEDRSATG